MMSSIPPVALNIYPVMSFQQLIVCVAAVWCCSSNAARQPGRFTTLAIPTIWRRQKVVECWAPTFVLPIQILRNMEWRGWICGEVWWLCQVAREEWATRLYVGVGVAHSGQLPGEVAR